MKTLDEVIEAQERCATYPNCHFCYLHSGPMCEWIRDALHYLKTYRENQHAYEEGNRKAEEARERFTALYKEYQERISNIEPRNLPLTWNELRTMEGKPVWVESSDSFNRRRWMFVGEWFDDDEMRLFDMGYDYPDYVSKNGYESGTWQAYRKERTDGLSA